MKECNTTTFYITLLMVLTLLAVSVVSIFRVMNHSADANIVSNLNGGYTSSTVKARINKAIAAAINRDPTHVSHGFYQEVQLDMRKHPRVACFGEGDKP